MRGRGPGEAQEAAQGEALTVHEEAQDLTSKFMSLSSDALTLQCQQLENARHSGKQQWMEKQGFFEGLSKMCAALAEKDTQKVAQVAHQEKAKMTMVEEAVKKRARHTASQSIALGCTSLLKAKNNGKMEWFESQAWYKRAMRVCTSLSGASPRTMDKHLQPQKGTWVHKIGSLERKMPSELLKETCAKLSKTAQGDAVREMQWFKKAERMCATVASSSPGELVALVRRQEHHAETASGQLVKQTCAHLKHSQKLGELKNFQQQAWYPGMLAMCSKLGTKRVRGASLERRCQWFEKMRHMGKEKAFSAQAWYKHLASTCTWLQHNKEKSVMGEQASVMV